ncbi:helix-turn-helix domain-containing protein [Hominimerdicola sp. 21CYCFAH17_S]
MTQQNMPEYETIRAAVAGEKWAVEKVLECYADEIGQLATIEKKQPDGSMKKEIDENMRQALVLKLIEAIPQFPLDTLEREGNGNGNKKSQEN